MFWLEGRGSGHIEEGSGVWESPKDLCSESQEVWADRLPAGQGQKSGGAKRKPMEVQEEEQEKSKRGAEEFCLRASTHSKTG